MNTPQAENAAPNLDDIIYELTKQANIVDTMGTALRNIQVLNDNQYLSTIDHLDAFGCVLKDCSQRINSLKDELETIERRNR